LNFVIVLFSVSRLPMREVAPHLPLIYKHPEADVVNKLKIGRIAKPTSLFGNIFGHTVRTLPLQ